MNKAIFFLIIDNCDRCPYSDCDLSGQYLRKWNEDNIEKIVYGQKKQISKKASINRSFLKGFRLPFLDQNGDEHLKYLKKFSINYDSSVLIKPDSIKKNNGLRFWPHTLKFDPNYTCPTCPNREIVCQDQPNECPLDSIWIVPLHYLNAEGDY